MSCERFRDRIALAAGGDLDGQDRELVERHLRSCAGCRRLFEELRESRRAVGELRRTEIPEDVLAGIRAGVLAEIESRRKAERRVLGFPVRPAPRPAAWLAAAAAVLLILGASWWILRPDGERPGPRVAEDRSADARTPDREPPRPDPLPEGGSATPPSEIPGPPGTSHPDPLPEAVTTLATLPEAPSTTPPPPAIEPSPPGEAMQPMLVKWHVEDPDLVIYWMVETDESIKEPEHAISEV